jgi:hypothetical protein
MASHAQPDNAELKIREFVSAAMVDPTSSAARSLNTLTARRPSLTWTAAALSAG